MTREIIRLEGNKIIAGSFAVEHFANGRYQTNDYLTLLKTPHTLHKKPFFRREIVNLGRFNCIVVKSSEKGIRTKAEYTGLKGPEEIEVDVFNDRHFLHEFVLNPEFNMFTRPITISLPIRYHLAPLS